MCTIVILSNEPQIAGNMWQHLGGARDLALASHIGRSSLVLRTQKASMTIQPQGGVPCSERYKLNNKLQNFDGTSHGTFVLFQGTIDGITGQHSIVDDFNNVIYFF